MFELPIVAAQTSSPPAAPVGRNKPRRDEMDSAPSFEKTLKAREKELVEAEAERVLPAGQAIQNQPDSSTPPEKKSGQVESSPVRAEAAAGNPPTGNSPAGNSSAGSSQPVNPPVSQTLQAMQGQATEAAPAPADTGLGISQSPAQGMQAALNNLPEQPVEVQTPAPAPQTAQGQALPQPEAVEQFSQAVEAVQPAQVAPAQAAPVTAQAAAVQAAKVEGAEAAAVEGAETSPAESVSTTTTSTPAVATEVKPGSDVRANAPQTARIEVQAAEASRQVTQAIEASIQQGRNSIRLQLHPHDLGAIDVRLVSTPHGVGVTVFADQAGTGRLLETQIDQLRQSLNNAGVQLAHLNINPQAQSGHQGNAFMHHSGGRPSYAAGSFQSGESEAVMPQVLRLSGVGQSVDYQV